LVIEMMKKLLLLLWCCWLLAGCGAAPPTPTPVPRPAVFTADDLAAAPRIPMDEAKARFDAGDALFVDVRSANLFAASHIAGAVNLTLGELQLRHGELPKDRLLVFY